MGLANVLLSKSEFERIYGHLVSYRPEYRNMHLRQTKLVGKKTVLRYLHAMIVYESRMEIEGMISGPNVFCHYKLKQVAGGVTQLNILSEIGSSAEINRLGKRFLKEIMDRIEFEQTNKDNQYFPKRSKGQFYLRRRTPGTTVEHVNCQEALNSGVLHREFVEVLSSWNLELMRGAS